MGFTEEEWEAVSQELPSSEDVFIQKYIKGREALIAEEQKKRSGKWLLAPGLSLPM